jgi:hypothetical protein
MSFTTLIPWTTASCSLHVPTQNHICHYTSSKLISCFVTAAFFMYISNESGGNLLWIILYYLCIFLCDPVLQFCVEQWWVNFCALCMELKKEEDRMWRPCPSIHLCVCVWPSISD